ncbi:MAG TPA: LysR family transcriptional regulator [Steroidobacteraceae bacterium]|nr:LysR family transcriptional regulator [Steroidobacteraceae bacterium]
MDRDLLSHLPVVVAVAREKGFAAAASAMNMSASAVSHAVKAVEDRLGEPLFARTTRSVSLTETGARLIATFEAALEDIGSAVETLAAARGSITGTLRVNAPHAAFAMGLTRVIARLAWEHPRLVVEVHTDEAFIDIVAQGYDAGVRLGEAVQQDMVTVRLTDPFLAIMVASPDYLRAKGEPKSLADLAGHNCIGYRLQGSGRLYEWHVVDGGKETRVAPPGSAVVTDATSARELALAGVGIAYLAEPMVREDLRAGRLRWLLPDSASHEDGLFVYFPRRASMAPKLRAFIEASRERA